MLAKSLMSPPATPREFVAYQIHHVTLLIVAAIASVTGDHPNQMDNHVNHIPLSPTLSRARMGVTTSAATAVGMAVFGRYVLALAFPQYDCTAI